MLTLLSRRHAHNSHKWTKRHLVTILIASAHMNGVKLPEMHDFLLLCLAANRPTPCSGSNGVNVNGKRHTWLSPTDKHRAAQGVSPWTFYLCVCQFARWWARLWIEGCS